MAKGKSSQLEGRDSITKEMKWSQTRNLKAIFYIGFRPSSSHSINLIT